MKYLTIDEAAALLEKNEIVAVPTETVYGLAANALNDDAVSKIFKAKGRPSDNPLIVHVGDVEKVKALIIGDIPPNALKLMDAFWPGPLSIILKAAPVVSKIVTAGLDTVALRMPDHPVTLALLKSSQLPLAAPSANLSGKPSPTTAKHVASDLLNNIAGVIDGGPCTIGLESTVIDMTKEIPVILRPGVITKEDIERIIGTVFKSEANHEKNIPSSPGMKYKHYAPNGELFIVDNDTYAFTQLANKYAANGLKVGILCEKGNVSKYAHLQNVFDIGELNNLLYDSLRRMDNELIDIILCEKFENEVLFNRTFKASKERIISEMEN